MSDRYRRPRGALVLLLIGIAALLVSLNLPRSFGYTLELMLAGAMVALVGIIWQIAAGIAWQRRD